MGPSLLTPGQSQILGSVAQKPYLKKHFYFTGGTALSAVYFQHRLSDDLDFFSHTPINTPSLNVAIKQMTEILTPSNIEYQTLNEQFIYYFTLGKERIKVDFAYFPFDPLGSFTKFRGLNTASLEDLAVNKLQAISTRARGRDYFDLYFLMTLGHFTVKALMQLYRLKFDLQLMPEEVAKNFMQVKEAQDQPRYLGTRPWRKVEDFFLTQAKNLKPAILKP
jgi:predicted nucleotidyltransferase component of viral defense system